MRTKAPAQPHPSLSPCRACGRRHVSWHTLARCRWRRAVWVAGEGRYASVSLCGHSVGRGRMVYTTVELHPTRESAERAKAIIDRLGCGGRCCRDHFVTDLVHSALR